MPYGQSLRRRRPDSECGPLAAGRDTAAELALRRELTRRGYRIGRDLGLPASTAPHRPPTPKSRISTLAHNVALDREADRIATQHGWEVVGIGEHQHPAIGTDLVGRAAHSPMTAATSRATFQASRGGTALPTCD